MLDTLNNEDRMRLMQLLCAVAWVDGEVQEGERELVLRLADEMKLADGDLSQVQSWLAAPPTEGAPAPEKIPPEHRQLFNEHALELIAADGELKSEELKHYRVYKMLMEWSDGGDGSESIDTSDD